MDELARELIKKKGLIMESRIVEEVSVIEAYVLIKVKGLEIYIYDDGEAGIFGEGIDHRYELLDYNSFDELKDRFIVDLDSLLSRDIK